MGCPFLFKGIFLTQKDLGLLRLLIGRWILYHGFLGGASDKEQTRVQSLGQEDPLEEERATHSSILAWRIAWTEELVELQSIGSRRVGHN